VSLLVGMVLSLPDTSTAAPEGQDVKLTAR